MRWYQHLLYGTMFGPKYWFDSEFRDKLRPPEPEPDPGPFGTFNVFNPMRSRPPSEKEIDQARGLLVPVLVVVAILSIIITIVRIRGRRA